MLSYLKMIKDEYFIRYKELTRKKLGDEKYCTMTEQELFDGFMKLITLMEAVYQHTNKQTVPIKLK
jgi:hypothetical protein